jgi:hypothetical protein
MLDAYVGLPSYVYQGIFITLTEATVVFCGWASRPNAEYSVVHEAPRVEWGGMPRGGSYV